MPSYNKIILMGNLTRDPQLTYLPSNTPVTEIGMAVNRRFKKQDGSQGEEVLFIDCRAFGRTAEVINQYFKKGEPILVEGRLQLDQWTDKEGGKRSKHRVHIDSFEFVSTRGSGGSSPAGDEPDHAHAPPPPRRSAPTSAPPPGPVAGEGGDIPF
jgi:single-strand DNA-binding protein